MPLLEREKIWVPWTPDERKGGIDFQHVLTRKWRDRYAALRERQAVHPYFGADSITNGTYQQVGPTNAYIRIPRYARFLLARCLVRSTWSGSGANLNFVLRIDVGSYSSLVLRQLVHEDAQPAAIETQWDGTLQDHSGITWWNMTPIIPNPSQFPNGFDSDEWDLTELAVEYYLAGSVENSLIEINADRRQWSWLTEDRIPEVSVWQKEPSEYA